MKHSADARTPEGAQKHTPGPWEMTRNAIVKVAPDRSHCIILGNRDNWNNTLGFEQNEANARLIAAAPDLLDCLSWLVRACEVEPCMSIYSAHIDLARAAVRKATGDA